MVTRLLGLLLLLAMTGTSMAADRVALIIGNGAYENATALPNPKNDAEDTKRLLTDLGFEVVHGVDLDREGMEATIRQFATSSASASIVLFFYAGHGMQVDGQNYLIPIDAKLQDRTALDFEAINVDKVLRYMSGDEKIALVFLDACRNNPLARSFAQSLGATRSSSVGGGLAPTNNAGSGLFIAYATAPNDVALDGEGRNSPFTAALLKHLPTPNLEIQQVMTRVKASVQKETSGRQRPWHNSDLGSEVFLAPSSPAPVATVDPADQRWLELKNSSDTSAIQAFIDKFPNSKSTSDAKARLEQLAAIPKPPFEPAVRLDAAERCRRLSEVLVSDKIAGVPGTKPQEIYDACSLAVIDLPDDGDLAWRLSRAAENTGRLEEQGRNLRSAARLGHDQAKYEYAIALANDASTDAIPYDPAKAEIIALNQMNRDDWRAARVLYFVYVNGPKKDVAKSEEWRFVYEGLIWASASSNPSGPSIEYISLLQRKHSNSRLSILLRASSEGIVSSYRRLAIYYSQDHGSEASKYGYKYIESLRELWLRGSAKALYMMGREYHFGTMKNMNKAVELYKRAIDEGYTQAATPLYSMLNDSNNKQIYDPSEAKRIRLLYLPNFIP